MVVVVVYLARVLPQGFAFCHFFHFSVQGSKVEIKKGMTLKHVSCFFHLFENKSFLLNFLTQIFRPKLKQMQLKASKKFIILLINCV